MGLWSGENGSNVVTRKNSVAVMYRQLLREPAPLIELFDERARVQDRYGMKVIIILFFFITSPP